MQFEIPSTSPDPSCSSQRSSRSRETNCCWFHLHPSGHWSQGNIAVLLWNSRSLSEGVFVLACVLWFTNVPFSIYLKIIMWNKWKTLKQWNWNCMQLKCWLFRVYYQLNSWRIPFESYCILVIYMYLYIYIYIYRYIYINSIQ